MRQALVAEDARTLRILKARQLFFQRGDLPGELLSTEVLRSWQRCHRSGIETAVRGVAADPVAEQVLKQEQDRSRSLISYALPVMEHVYEHIHDSGCVVVLADSNGLLLHSLGDPDFVSRAQRVALQPGSSWDESVRGTNAIGTALVEERPLEVFGAEHFLDHNGFLTCSSAPLRDSYGNVIGVLDISTDFRRYQPHTFGLVRMSAQMVERRLFDFEQSRQILVCFHSRDDYLGTLGEGVLAVNGDGFISAVNVSGLELLGLRRQEVMNRDFSVIFEGVLGRLVDQARREPERPIALRTREGKTFYVRLRGNLPAVGAGGRVIGVAEEPIRPVRLPEVQPAEPAEITLESLCTGDPRIQAAVDRARRVIGRDIPILIQGESGAGKEIFAKAFHNSSPRRDRPFVALNCAAIPENLIESELFGYQGGAFTGARKEGAVGKIQQAHGGTLFLDEIGDMPLALQARLLRVLQERCVTPLGSGKTIPVDIALVCATHRRLRDEVARGAFREDLYFRLNGLSVTLPPLRERADLRQLVHNIIGAEAEGRAVQVSESTMRLFEAYPWPGNIRQLTSVLRVALALLDDDESEINECHLLEDLLEAASDAPIVAPMAEMPASAAMVRPLMPGGEMVSLEEMERQAIQRTLEAVGGNISAAARKLGISRNTLYRRLGQL
ncbi:sigma-54-dependent Fis family transcriptional regulator [Oryzomicrobium sp.]|uniref:sigma-54-dependent Fis family transcriptional regulator n=1 Tax=Oryzomicrobium sp. TaxID=1911578 RepID=UPI002FE14D44